ncbi:transmembrane protein 163 isoform X2 [Lingula anatina]|uniref:Transmembrane protein 163 isoform X2 n=1 Tax=Lingula anatina TaxID=7574 RepID=A0A1S3JF89_LINAN|nr:transmembrane protein 163 isoform X2 [Lingula anatina]|eukprot:XP_013408559.1 transmembrane protein 163 isoform X2 [Lingula anatina]
MEATEMQNREDSYGLRQPGEEKLNIPNGRDSVNNLNGIFNKEHVVSALEKSPALFAFGLSCILDSLSSLVVIWRFQFGEGRLYSTSREKRACFVLGVLFTISASSIVSKAIHAIVVELRPGEDNSILWNIAIANGVICSSLSVAKFAMGLKLESRALITDAYNSLVGALMSFAILASALAYRDNHAVWYLDSVVGLICAVLLLGYAIKLFCHIYHDRSSTPPSD